MSTIDTLLRRPFIHGHELRQGIESFAHHVCSALGLRPVSIHWSEGISTAGINQHGALALAAVLDDARITRPALVRYVGYIVHELLHRKSTKFGIMGRITGTGEQYRRSLLNAVEDARIEREAIASNLLGNIEGVLHDLLGQMVSEALAQVPDWGDPKQYPFSLAVTLRDYPGLACPMPAQVQAIAAEALARMPGVKSTEDALTLSEWVYSQLQQMDEEQDQGQDQGQDQEGQEGEEEEGQEGEGQGEEQGEEGEGEGEGQEGQGEEGQGEDGEEGNGQGQGKGEGKGQAQGEAQGQEEAQGKAQEGQGEGKAQEGEAQEGQKKKPKAKRPEQATEAVEVEPSTGGRPENEGATGAYTRSRAIAPNGHHTKGTPQQVRTTVPARLRYELRRLFENTAQTLHLNNRKTGRLNPGALARHQIVDTVFRKRLDIEGIDSAVVICLDLSGSMYNAPSRIKAAIPACYALADTLTAAGVNVAVVTFDLRASVAVPFDTSRRATLDTITRIHGGDQYTDDWYALRLAHDLLHRRQEQRKVVFFISDGCGMVPEMQSQVRAGTALGITTLGVGIEFDVSDIYGKANSITVNTPADLGTAAFSRMKLAA